MSTSRSNSLNLAMCLALKSTVRLHRDQLVKPYAAMLLPYTIPSRIVEDSTTSGMRHRSDLMVVRDIVAFPDVLMLMIAAVDGTLLPSRYNLQCVFGEKYKTAVVTSEWKDDPCSIIAVRCEYPPQFDLESNQASLLFNNFLLPSRARFVTNSSGKPLVYETVTLTNSILLFVKGLLDSRGKPNDYSRCLHKLSCCFGSSTNTNVIGVAQEVVRCELPSRNQIQQLQGSLISLAVPKIGVLPSVAYFDSPRHSKKLTNKMFHICSCTMLWNEARFLREWIMYHGFLGIERWFVYDNNSEDDIVEVLDALQALKYNVSRHTWPWIKTQEAAFSHCALRARADCEWVLFTDVDEFVYPGHELEVLSRAEHSSVCQQATNSTSHMQRPGDCLNRSNETILQRLIQDTLKRGEAFGNKVGEVRLRCHNFGPSGRLHAPEEGVMVGYTCRLKWPQRHKSFILLEAMSDSLLNVVHHFALRKGYEEMAVQVRVAVINHYKYQAWQVFKAKFVRRAATYVLDWRDQPAQSNDRAPGLGLEAVEPPDWPARYCEEEDWGLRNFTWNMFRHPRTQRLPWQATEGVKDINTSSIKIPFNYSQLHSHIPE